MTPCEDLRGQSPREYAREAGIIDFDLQSRSLQWSWLNKARRASRWIHLLTLCGFGTHEWVVYYDLVRHLLCSASGKASDTDLRLFSQLEELKTIWLNEPQPDYDGRIPLSSSKTSASDCQSRSALAT